MKKLIGFIIFSLLFVNFVQAQQIKGIVIDASTEEPLIMANVTLASTTQGTVTDFDGSFSLQLPNNNPHDLEISYIGYETSTKTINPVKQSYIEIRLEPKVLDEVVIVADVARSRETPVAFSNVQAKQIQEELAGRDMVMVLNSTPGVYATQSGGGDGDAVVRIRGFNQRHVGVLLDGIPVNDMENGWVYWSNWFGLDGVVRTTQVQRGLGASKLALPSVGGTMNIVTKGIGDKRELKINQSVSSTLKTRTSVSLNTGRMTNGWGVTLAGSYKRGDGWVDGTFAKGWFYYAKIEKQYKKHIFSLTAYGAPQEHAQRSYTRPIATYDSVYAVEEGVDTFPNQPFVDLGREYNQHWGYLRRTRTDSAGAEKEKVYEKYNFYYKPMFYLRDSWSPSDKLFVSNIAYLSIGRGGGTRLNSTPGSSDYTDEGLLNWQKIYDANVYGTKYAKPKYIEHEGETLLVSTNFLEASKNDHLWYGLLSTFNYKLNDVVDLAGGVDLRSYTGVHYREIYDYLGGDCIVLGADNVKRKGDKIDYHDESTVRWGGLFLLAEYKQNNVSAFVNGTFSTNGYYKNDFMADTASDWKWQSGYTIKTGANYNLTDHMNIFFNVGYLSKVPMLRNAFAGYTVHFVDEFVNEEMISTELGYSVHWSRFAANLNAYYTIWANKPTTVYTGAGDDRLSGNANLDALHTGVEADFIYKLLPNLDFEGLVSLGSWTWQSNVENLNLYNDNNPDVVAGTTSFDVTGVHISDAAQTQLAGAIRYEPIDKLYLKARYTYFDRYFADFDIESYTVTGEGESVRDTWQIPEYGLLEIHAGYSLPLEKVRIGIRTSVLNVLDTKYISDAKNNDSYSLLPLDTYDANAATVFMGMGRYFTASLNFTF